MRNVQIGVVVALLFSSAVAGLPADAPGPEGRGLSGTVVDESGSPVAEAEVRVFPSGFSDETARVRTSRQGTFRIANLPAPASFELLALRPGLAPALLGVTVPALAESVEVTEVRLVLRRGHTAGGRVVDEKGRPVAGARVELIRHPAAALRPGWPAVDNGLYRSVTDREGRFQVAGLPERWFNLSVVRPGFLRLSWRAADLGRDADGRVDLGTVVLRHGKEPAPPPKPVSTEPKPRPALPPDSAGDLAGRVLTPDGSPAAGAAVVYMGLDGRRRIVTDGDGQFRFQGLQTGIGTLLARHETHGLRTLSVDVQPGKNHLDVNLNPLKFYPIRGRALDSEGRPVAGAWIANELSGESAFTSADGSFLLKTNRTGFALLARKPGHAIASLEDWNAEGAEGLELRLGPEASLSGRLLGLEGIDRARWPQVEIVAEHAGGPPPGQELAQVFDGGAGPDGIYRIPALAPGEWEVSARIDDRVATGRVVIAPGQTEPVLDLVFRQKPR